MFELSEDNLLDFDKALEQIKRAKTSRMMRAGLLVEAEMKRSLSTGGGERHEPSAPGSPPHLQSGVGRSSIKTARTGQGTIIVGPTTVAWYMAVHEWGGRHHPARPFARPALANTADKFPALFERLNFDGDA